MRVPGGAEDLVEVGGAAGKGDLVEVFLFGVEEPPGVGGFVDVEAGVVEEEEADAEALFVLLPEELCGGDSEGDGGDFGRAAGERHGSTERACRGERGLRQQRFE